MRCVPALPATAGTTGAAGLVDGSLTSISPLSDGMISLRVTTSEIDGRPLDIELVFAREQVAELCLLLERTGLARAGAERAPGGARTVPCSVGVKF